MSSEFKKITNKKFIFISFKILLGLFAFFFAFSGIRTFGAAYKVLPAILFAPLLSAFESEKLSHKLNFWFIAPVIAAAFVILLVIFLIFQDFEILNTYIKPHLEENKYSLIMFVVVGIALCSYIALIISESEERN